MNRSALLLVAVCAAISGCASVVSTISPKSTSGGLLYYMPKRDILVTVTNASGKTTSITAVASTPYADRSKTYQLEYQPHMLAKNAMDLDVNEAGLLTSTNANQTGDTVAALAGLGTVAGYMRGSSLTIQSAPNPGAMTMAAPTTNCTLDGNHTFLFPADENTYQICGNSIAVEITRLWTKPLKEPSSGLAEDQAYAGVFYRNNLPYKVKITSGVLNAEVIVHSPSESSNHFLPVARTLFANNDAKVTLNNGAGVPSKYSQNTDGEVAALLKLPAAIVAPYFAAIGQVFTWKSAERSGQTSDVTSAIALELAKIKYQKCLDAIESKDTELIASLKCGGN